MALSTAAGAPIAPPSPTPLAPVIEASVTVWMWVTSMSGISQAVGGRKSMSEAVTRLPSSSVTSSS